MTDFNSILQPILGACTGILLFALSDKVAVVVQKLLEKFPKYEKNLCKDSSVKPIYIKIVGIFYFCIAVYGLLVKLNS